MDGLGRRNARSYVLTYESAVSWRSADEKYNGAVCASGGVVVSICDAGVIIIFAPAAAVGPVD